MFGNRRGFGGGYRGGYDGPPRKFPRYNEEQQWPRLFPPPPPPPARVHCGQLRRMDVGKMVEVSGRLYKVLQDRFVHLKDTNGITQFVISPDRSDLVNRFTHMPLQSLVTVIGEVQVRPHRTFNEKWATGEVEVTIEEVIAVKINKIDQKVKVDPSIPQHSDGQTPKITSEEYHKFQGLLPQLNERQYTCGDLAHKLNEHVSLLCWVERCSKKFLTLVDGYGKIQCVVPDNDEVIVTAEHLTKNAVVIVKGKITQRPKANINYTVHNGHLELQIEKLEWPTFDMDNLANNDTLPAKSGEDEDEGSRLSARTHTCGALGLQQAGLAVTLCGRLASVKVDKFLVIEDHTGAIQCVLTPEHVGMLKDVKCGSIVKVEGVVALRPPGARNEILATGEIDIVTKSLEVLSKAENKSVLTTELKKCESARLRHRYMDLCSKQMQNNLRLKSKLLQNMRNLLLDKLQFVEVDTPTITSWVEGVSSLKVQTEEEECYLVSSPLAHFTLLMAGMMDRCFNISTAYLTEPVQGQRESLRLNMAVSYGDMSGGMALVERLLQHTLPLCVDKPPYKRLDHCEALYMYGSHAPDLSYDLKLHDVTEVLISDEDTDTDKYGAHVLIYPRQLGKQSAAMVSLLEDIRSKHSDVTISHNVAKDVSPVAEKSLRSHTKLDQSDGFFLAFGNKENVCKSLGAVRVQLATDLSELQLLHRRKAGACPVWVTHAPCMSASLPSLLVAVHPDDEEIALEDITKARSQSFRLVMNGEVYATGWVGCSDAAQLARRLAALPAPHPFADKIRYALQFGCPPYVFVCLDVNKLVAMACNAPSVRDVISFPKSQDGRDLLVADCDNLPGLDGTSISTE